ncbi:MAG: adenylate kinase [Verrucomicrobiota bacterium]
MDIVILLGPPGAGKGTLAEIVRDKTGYEHVATGDMLRDAVKRGTETGKKAEGYMKSGELVPDSVIAELVEDRLDSGSGSGRFLFDGYPRTAQQAELLDKSVGERDGKISRVFLLEASRETLISRLTGRRICRQCGRNYHVVNRPPQREGICDECGGELYQRPDDKKETIENRLDVYDEQTKGLISRYESEGKLDRVNSDQDPDAAAGQIVDSMSREE